MIKAEFVKPQKSQKYKNVIKQEQQAQIYNQEIKIDDTLECQICLEEFDQFYKIPYQLTKCSHVLCLLCIENLLQSLYNECPFCRKQDSLFSKILRKNHLEQIKQLNPSAIKPTKKPQRPVRVQPKQSKPQVNMANYTYVQGVGYVHSRHLANEQNAMRQYQQAKTQGAQPVQQNQQAQQPQNQPRINFQAPTKGQKLIAKKQLLKRKMKKLIVIFLFVALFLLTLTYLLFGILNYILTALDFISPTEDALNTVNQSEVLQFQQINQYDNFLNCEFETQQMQFWNTCSDNHK